VFSSQDMLYGQPFSSNCIASWQVCPARAASSLRAAHDANPPSMVGETYAQLLSMEDPEQNVVVASPREPFATQGGNALIEPQAIAENETSAIPLQCD
jgi:hypothetical protein